MTRHPFRCGLVLNFVLVSSTLAQHYTDQSTAQQRVSQLRPGWSREGVDPATNRARYTVAPAPVQMVEDSDSGSRSFLPKWLSWPTKKSDQPTKPNTNQRQNMQKSGTAAKQRLKTEDEAAPPDPATMQDEPLPGLGGSPLPRTNRSTSTTPDNPLGNFKGATAPVPQPRTVQPKPKSAITSKSNISGTRTASREPAAASSSSSGAAAAQGATTRNSPSRRTAPHITAEELRRELSGTFPATANNTEPNERAAEADGPTVASPNDANAAGDVISDSEDADALVSDTPVTLPTTTSADKPTMPAVKAKVQAGEQVDTDAAIGTDTSKSVTDGFVTPRSRSSHGAGSSVRMPTANPTTPPQTTRGKEAFGDALQAAIGGDPNVLASNQTPVLTVDIRGPKQILVGRESTYRVRLQNQSDVPAEGVVATVKIPSGAEVVNTNATQGSVQPSADAGTSGQLQWHLARLDRRGNETLELRLIPRESRPLELGVTWTLAPVGSRAVVEVQEAKLNLEIAGPTEVLFDKPQTFKLTISNPGTGTAENVKIDLVPPGGAPGTVSSHPLGDLAAGASQTLEVELTPREAGKMQVKAIANAEGGLVCDATKEIFCRKPELEVDWRGPATKYTGTLATYYIRVRNPGTAPAEDVVVSTTLPEGAEFTSASEGQSYDPTRREVTWHVGSLGPGDDNYMELKCVLKSAGKNVVKISAANGAGNLIDAKAAETNVVAIADLKLEITDPSGPVAVGTQATYEIHVRNRGASAAKEISVVALFSDGIEPEQAEGAQFTVTDGRVSFKTIDELPAGREAVLKIRAHALQPGTHIFRAEVLCKDLEIKLAAEETTRFYADDLTPNSNPTQKEAVNRSNAFSAPVK